MNRSPEHPSPALRAPSPLVGRGERDGVRGGGNSQLPLPLTGAAIRRPTMDRAGVRGCLDIEDWQLDGLIDSGALGWVLDIASPGAERRELRFLTACVAAKRRSQESGVGRQETGSQLPHSQLTAERVLELLFGPAVPLVRAQRIYRALGCKPAHFYDLVAEGALPLARGSAQRPGPGGGGVVAWETLRAFVLKRRVA